MSTGEDNNTPSFTHCEPSASSGENLKYRNIHKMRSKYYIPDRWNHFFYLFYESVSCSFLNSLACFLYVCNHKNGRPDNHLPKDLKKYFVYSANSREDINNRNFWCYRNDGRSSLKVHTSSRLGWREVGLQAQETFSVQFNQRTKLTWRPFWKENTLVKL